MKYLNSSDNLYYTDQQFTTLAQGWDVDDNIYYINGVATGLDQTGTGYFQDNFTFYLNGQETSLGFNGSGIWNGNLYLKGILKPENAANPRAIRLHSNVKFLGNVKFAV